MFDDRSDGPDARPVVVISQRMAERFFPGDEALAGESSSICAKRAAAAALHVVASVPHEFHEHRGVTPVGIGTAAGLLLALASGRLIATVLFEVRPTDPLTLAVVAITLLLVAAAACLGPALRAMRIDPVQALRYD